MMQFIDLNEQYSRLKIEIDNNINKVLKHGIFIMGSEVNELEYKLAKYLGVKHAVTCSSGTDALLMPLMAWNIGPGDAVFTTTFTFIATAEAIRMLGATPIFVDIDENTFNISIESLEDKIEKTIRNGRLIPKAIIPVDLFGLPADYDKLQNIAKKYGLRVLEDAAQGFGGIYMGKKAGSFGDAAATSFFPAKPLGCYGDGGAVFTDDDELADKLRSIRVHGQGKNKYDNIRIGINGRLDTMQAAILLVKLNVFNEELEKRNEIAKMYTSGLEDIIRTPLVPEGFYSSWAQYSVMANDSREREEIRSKLKIHGIPTAIYYPIPLHLQTVFSDLGYNEGDFPISEDVSRRIFSIPMHPYLNEERVSRIIEAVVSR